MFLSMSAVRPDCVDVVGECVRRALVKAQLNNKQAAALMGISTFELSRMKRSRGVNLARLLMLGPVFMAHFQVPSSRGNCKRSGDGWDRNDGRARLAPWRDCETSGVRSDGGGAGECVSGHGGRGDCAAVPESEGVRPALVLLRRTDMATLILIPEVTHAVQYVVVAALSVCVLLPVVLTWARR